MCVCVQSPMIGDGNHVLRTSGSLCCSLYLQDVSRIAALQEELHLDIIVINAYNSFHVNTAPALL